MENISSKWQPHPTTGNALPEASSLYQWFLPQQRSYNESSGTFQSKALDTKLVLHPKQQAEPPSWKASRTRSSLHSVALDSLIGAMAEFVADRPPRALLVRAGRWEKASVWDEGGRYQHINPPRTVNMECSRVNSFQAGSFLHVPSERKQ